MNYCFTIISKLGHSNNPVYTAKDISVYGKNEKEAFHNAVKAYEGTGIIEVRKKG